MKLSAFIFCILLVGIGTDSMAVTPIPKLLRVKHTPTPTPTVTPTPKPIVQTLPAANLTTDQAKLQGRVNPNGNATTIHFSYGTTASYGTNTTALGVGSGHSVLTKGKTVTGLSTGTTYHYRIVATNSGGTTSGADITFITGTTPTPTPPPTPTPTATPTPIPVTGAATNISPTSATLNGTVNPKGSETTYGFDRGTSISYGTSTTETSAGADNTALDESADISGLTPSTLYHFRIHATNPAGTVNGADATFTTGTPTPTPAPSPTPPTNPKGLYTYGTPYTGGDTSFMTNFNGVRVEVRWDQINTANNIYNWTAIDAIVATIQGNSKQVGIAVRILSDVPQWVKDLPVTTYSYQGADMVLPWDTAVRPKIIAFITALCQHFDGIDYMVMGGLGYRTETYMPLPADIGLGISNSAFLALWVTSCEGLIDTYHTYLPRTVFWVAGGKVFNDSGAQAASSTVIEYVLAYSHGGVQQWGLSASSNNGFFVNKYIQDNPTHSGGFQMNGASDGSGGGNVCGSLVPPACTSANSLSLALDNGVNLNGDVIEVYGVDAANPAYAALFALINAELLSSQ